ncbi:nitrite reductase small subunit NirD [Gracilibacillus suaedae]|uniref:nitrite reductase small subunit NirD n=1 Tax=Gracilibacillus suaedae TaxID=2820273 RepID=UPI001ABDD0C9|nr:nitrite reductase small subunit NirD [Gracilibacillus suaedae]
MERTIKKVWIGKIADFPVSLGKAVRVEDRDIAVFHLSNGKIRAIANKCPHRGGVLSEGMVANEFVFCPMHDWKINVSDGKVQAPDEGCVQTFPTHIEDHQVYVEMPI